LAADLDGYITQEDTVPEITGIRGRRIYRALPMPYSIAPTLAILQDDQVPIWQSNPSLCARVQRKSCQPVP